MPRILVIEDEEPIQYFVKVNLERHGLEVVQAFTGEEGLGRAREEAFDLIVLDIRLPGMDGFEVCRGLRQTDSNTPIIMLTARSEDVDKILGLEMGADDYLTKPFNPRELVARIKAVLRRSGVPASGAPANQSVVESGPLRIDLDRREVWVRSRQVDLTPKEFDLLLTLARHPGKVLSRDEILDHTWGPDFFGDPKTLDVHIRHLREKIEEDPRSPRMIATVWGVGYKWIGGDHHD